AHYVFYGANGKVAKVATTASSTDPHAVSYVYYSASQRVLKTDPTANTPAATTHTLYADADSSAVLGIYSNQRSASSASASVVPDMTEVIYLPTAQGLMPIVTQINGRIYAIHSDHLNTPRRLSTPQGQVAWQWLLSGFGEASPTTGDAGYVTGSPGATGSMPSYAPEVVFNLRYPGQQWDEETGLAYNVYRYYDKVSGRYIQADPIGLDGGWNRFGYVGGNPLNGVDPLGLFEVVWHGKEFTTPPPLWVRQLREYGAKLETKIKSLCSSDAEYLLSYYSKWKVGANGRPGSPTTDPKIFYTNFTSDYFKLENNFFNPFEKGSEDPYAVFLHEFRHLMNGNVKLNPGGSEYLKHRLNGTTDKLSIEIDADAYALELFKGKCTCGSMQR
ncbi:RHS repeat-associated protein, partial [Comamonas odontotermitis]